MKSGQKYYKLRDLKNNRMCTSCRKPIGEEKCRQHEFMTTNQGTLRNFRAYFVFWHESCWQQEKTAKEAQERQMNTERDKEIAEARLALLNAH